MIKEREMIKELTQEEIDYLADMVWWLKGYYNGANSSFENCPFNENHLDALDKAIENEKSRKYDNRESGGVYISEKLFDNHIVRCLDKSPVQYLFNRIPEYLIKAIERWKKEQDAKTN